MSLDMTRGKLLVLDMTRGKLLVLGGAAVLLVGSLLPWASYPGFPGLMTLSFTFSGARLYCMLLSLVGLVALTPFAGRGRSVRVAGYCAVGISLLTALLIGYAGSGLVNVSAGAWVAVVGAIAMAVGGNQLAEPEDPKPLPDRLGVLEPLVVLAFVGLALLIFVEGLGIPTANVADGKDYRLAGRLSLNDLTNDSQFLDFVILVIGLVTAGARLGVFKVLGAINQRHRYLLVTAAILAAMAFPFTQNGSAYSLRIGATVGVFACAAIGLNVVVGLAGLLDLGYIAFFGIGAYFAALFSGTSSSVFHVHLPFVLVFVLGAAVSGLFGVLLGAPTLRLRGDYLAIVTLGFGEIFRIASNNLDGNAGPRLTNGPNGISDVPDLAIGSYNFGAIHRILGIDIAGFANYYWLEVLLLVLFMTAFLRMSQSRIGRAWVAIREDELAAAATGINTTRLKLLAFGIGATLAGGAGTVEGHVLPIANPDSFTFLQSATLLAAVILGGMGTVPGALLGATVLVMLPEKLRFLTDLRLLVFGISLVLIMRLRPEGLVPSRRRQREFHEGEGDALGQPVGAHL
jgi:branched-chain amino acid transport system permease protein